MHNPPNNQLHCTYLFHSKRAGVLDLDDCVRTGRELVGGGGWHDMVAVSTANQTQHVLPDATQNKTKFRLEKRKMRVRLPPQPLEQTSPTYPSHPIPPILTPPSPWLRSLTEEHRRKTQSELFVFASLWQVWFTPELIEVKLIEKTKKTKSIIS